MTYKAVLVALDQLKNADKVSFKEQKFGIISKNALGIYHQDLKLIAKEVGQDNHLALQLFDSEIYEARLLCSMIFNPKDLTEDLMEKWVITFENWEICDSFCMALFSKSQYALSKIDEWSDRKPEFEKRASFATIASYCIANKTSDNKIFEAFFPLIIQEANDDRIYVKKGINWALRNIGKRNVDLHKKAIEVAHEMFQFDSKSAQWIAKNALSELQKEGVRCSDYPRYLYR